MNSPANPLRRRPFWKRLLLAPFALVAAIVLGFIDWLWSPLLRLAMRLGSFPMIRRLEEAISRMRPYPALLLFAVPALLLVPFKIVGLYLMAHGQRTAGIAVFVAAKAIGTALVARIFSLTSPALMSLPWFNRLYVRFVDYKRRLYDTVFGHPWIRLLRRGTRRWANRLGTVGAHLWRRLLG